MMLPLADVVRDLRAELYKAVEAATSEPLQFDVGTIQLDLTTAVTREGGTSGKVRFWVVELGAEGSIASVATQKLTLNLTPRLAAGGQVTISGAAELDESTGT